MLAKYLVFDPHWGLLTENSRVHEFDLRLNQGPEIHLRQNILLEIYSGSDFCQGHSFRAKLEYRALGNIEDFLAAGPAIVPAKGDMFDLVDHFVNFSFLGDFQAAVANPEVEAAGRESPAENDPFGALSDVYEASGPSDPGAEFADIDVAEAVHLRHAQHGQIQASPS